MLHYTNSRSFQIRLTMFGSQGQEVWKLLFMHTSLCTTAGVKGIKSKVLLKGILVFLYKDINIGIFAIAMITVEGLKPPLNNMSHIAEQHWREAFSINDTKLFLFMCVSTPVNASSSHQLLYCEQMSVSDDRFHADPCHIRHCVWELLWWASHLAHANCCASYIWQQHTHLLKNS